MVGEILQDSESYILLWWDKYYERWQTTHKKSYKEAISRLNEWKKLDKKNGDITRFRIVKETTKQEVVYDEL